VPPPGAPTTRPVQVVLGEANAGDISRPAVDILGIERLYIGIMAKKPELLQGTLDMLILNTLKRAPLHGYAIAQSIKRLSGDVLTVEEGSLYPALQRLLLRGWVKAHWKLTETNRKARYYKLTTAGRKQLGNELSQFEEVVAAICPFAAGQSLEPACRENADRTGTPEHWYQRVRPRV
jgi:PadR family transcriptional regulator